ncbi:hypothetical protein [Leptospira stimsonii]|uniref:Uncharacterized protein n=1 Tax=Leptospira stimsonii TaxID=2202203 RepID=A0A8B3CM05_9LEPT|nr:hypothetical protein [Leptospira stimsonii]RHX83297.1 hypothetical protein DLM78_22615 [Leptospira stimsonii]
MKNEISASVQYGDYFGEIACDGFNGPFLNEIAVKNGIDIINYFPLTLKMKLSEFGNTFVELYICDKKVFGENIENIRNKAVEKGELEVTKVEISISIDELLKNIKRLEIFSKISGVSDIKFVQKEGV